LGQDKGTTIGKEYFRKTASSESPLGLLAHTRQRQVNGLGLPRQRAAPFRCGSAWPARGITSALIRAISFLRAKCLTFVMRGRRVMLLRLSAKACCLGRMLAIWEAKVSC